MAWYVGVSSFAFNNTCKIKFKYITFIHQWILGLEIRFFNINIDPLMLVFIDTQC